MKILLDTSVLFPGFKHPHLDKKLMGKIIEAGMTPVITDYILIELRRNIQEKYSAAQKAVALDLWLHILSMGILEVKYREEYLPNLEEALTLIVKKDAPVLAAAMLPDIDMLVCKDTQHFLSNKNIQKSQWQTKIKSVEEFLALF